MEKMPVITKMEVVPIAGFDSIVLNIGGAHSPIFTRTLVILHDSSGAVGVGETHGGEDMKVLLDAAVPFVEGRSISDYKNIIRTVRENRQGSCGIGGMNFCDMKMFRCTMPVEIAIEAALLDLLGKHMNVPVCSLLGDGKQRDEVEILGYLFYILDKNKTDLPYRDESDSPNPWFRRRNQPATTHEDLVEIAQAVNEQYGISNFKLKAGVFEGFYEMETIRAIKKAFPESRVNIDPNACWSLDQAIAYCKDASAYLAYAEDPCGPEDGYSGREILREFKNATGCRVATNMVTVNMRQLYHTISLGSVDIILADPVFWGLQDSVTVGRLLNEWRLTWGSHSNNHFDVTLAMYVQCAAAAPGNPTPMDTHYIWQDGQGVTKEPMQIKNGKIRIPDAPGLGVELDMKKVEEANALYNKLVETCGTAVRNDALAMQYFIPNWERAKGVPTMVR